jgi:hypothetical protein
MAVLIPEDYFEVDGQGDQGDQNGGGHSPPLFNPFEVMQQVSISSDLLQEGKDPCPKNKGLYMYNPATGRSMTLPCKSRLCPACGKGWGRNWQNRLGWNEFFHKDDKALTLTSAYDAGYKKFWLALAYFWRNIRNYAHVRPELLNKQTGEFRPKLFLKSDPAGNRKWLPLRQKKLQPGGDTYKIVRPFRKVEFFGVVEYNQKHTQPHFHFVLRSGYLPQKIIKKCWERAQVAAHFEKVAFDVRVEQIKSGVKQYFFKYITKMIKGKDELPRPENWQGRGVRYSRQFFAAPAAQVTAAIQLAEQNRRGDYSKFYPLHSRKIPAAFQMLDVDQLHASDVEAVSGQFNPFQDQYKAGEPIIKFYELQFVPHEPGTAKSYGFG